MSVMGQKFQKNIYYIAVFIIMICAAVLRIMFYSYERPFWNDESALAINLLHRTFYGLWIPLDYEQITPPLYSCFCKLCAFFIPNKEYAFRLPALLLGLASIPLFFLLVVKVIKNNAGRLFALLLFAFNYQLIYYSQELKQYSCDVFMFLAVLFSYFSINKENKDTKKILALSLFYSISFWFSYTAIFAVFILGLLCLKYGKKTIFYLFSLPFISGLLLIFYTHRFHADSVLNQFWAQGYIAFNFSNLKNIIDTNFLFYFENFPSKFLIIILFILGFFSFLKNIKEKESHIVISPFVFAILLSYACIYPLYLRTAIHILPLFFIIMAKTFDCLKIKNKVVFYFISAFIFAHFFVCTFKTDYTKVIKKQYYEENTKELLEIFAKKSTQQDILIVPNLTSINFEYYKQFVNINNKEIYIFKKPLYEYEEIKKVYDMLPEKHAYYILFTHSADKPFVYKNLCKYAQEHNGVKIYSDKNYNTLIRFEN